MSNNNELSQSQLQENQEWIDSLNYIIQNESPQRVRELLHLLESEAHKHGIRSSCPGNTPLINTISKKEEVPYPGNRDIERRIKSIIRWNAMAMVVRANKEKDGIGGHISSFASSATLYEVGFNHFFKGGENADIVYIQGHSAPGIYARAFLEGRLSEKDLLSFRRELNDGGGLSSYPHPRSMKDFWQFPTVSMGLASIFAIYQARFNRYLADRKLKDTEEQRVWAFLGDGEMDEPESLGAITLAAREKLDNLTFVINCNLQRLDGPVRGNGKIIQELEAAFKGAGWNVIKVMLDSNWDALLEKDKNGLLIQRWNELVDGQKQKNYVSGGAYIRKHFFNKYPELAKLVENYSDEDIEKLRRGGHDPVKVYNAYKAATEWKGGPTVILAHTIKGYGMGEAGEGRNITHQQKKLNQQELLYFRNRFNIPVCDNDVAQAKFYKPAADSEEIKYLKARREKLGGFLPKRNNSAPALPAPNEKTFKNLLNGSGDRKVATTMAFTQLLTDLLKDKQIGENIVPIVPDEARTFGMEALFRQVGIYSHVGQLYEPVDSNNFLYYKEAKDGTILEEGISEAGSMSSFVAAGTSYSLHNIQTIPFFIFYSMFGFQRVADLIWAGADMRARGFFIGGTSGRTTLSGEGLQHCDGQSHLFAMAIPSIRAYDPAFAYEISIIIEEGLKRMTQQQEDLIYYLTVTNEKYEMPAMPENIEKKDVLGGIYKYTSFNGGEKARVSLLGSGAIMNEAIKAGKIIEKYNIASDIWSVTSYKMLYDNGNEVERHNRFNPDNLQKTTIEKHFENEKADAIVAASDYVKAIPLSVSKWFPAEVSVLGTDGFGRSDDRHILREYFEVNANHIAYSALYELYDNNKIDLQLLEKAKAELNIDSEKMNPINL